VTATLASPAVWELRLPDKLKSLNEIKHHMARHKDTQNWENVLHNELYYEGIRSPTYPPRYKVKVTITRVMAAGEREFDDDNLVGGAKGLRDALKRLKWIRDDNREWLEVEYRQEKAGPGQRPGTRIRLEPAGGAQ
jgi:hypothetical protein